MRLLKSVAVILSAAAFIIAAPKDPLLGTWCAGEDGLVLTFAGKDSLIVTSSADASISGAGTYKRDDTTFTAILLNEGVEMKMKYQYKWLGKDTISAQAQLFTIGDEAVDFPGEWMSMSRCRQKDTKAGK